MTDEPVMSVAWWQTAITSLILAVGAILATFDVWNPTRDQIAAIAAGAAAIIAIIQPLIAFFFVRAKVTPVSSMKGGQ